MANYSSAQKAFFVEQILADIQNERGDSGAMVLNTDNDVVGMLISGDKELAIINKIENILNIMNISLYTQR